MGYGVPSDHHGPIPGLAKAAAALKKASDDYPQKTRVMTLDGDVSDLFFNLDFEDCKRYDPRTKEFTDFDEDKLRERATWFTQALYRVSGRLWSVDDVLADFKVRL